MAKIEIPYKWEYPLKNKIVKERINQLVKETGLRWEAVAILFNRGFQTKEAIDGFLSTNLNSLHDPRLLKDADKAADRIIEAINNKEEITVYTDFDADGWGAGVSAVLLFDKVGVKANLYSNKNTLGFGICKQGIDELLSLYPDTKLLITTDNGIVAFDAVEYANSKGLTVVITDHHEPHPDGLLPKAYAIVDPKRLDDSYPFKELCGAGLLFKLFMLIYYKLGVNPKDCYEVLDIVATSTVADVVPIVDENRAIVSAGLKEINSEKRLVWKVLREVMSEGSFEPITNVDAKVLGFTYGPAINACRRILGSIELPIKLFLLENTEANLAEMTEIVQKMKSVNDERKVIQKDLTNGAISLVAQKDEDIPAIVIAHDEFLEGIVGIIAGNLKEMFNKPTVVFAQDESDPSLWKGSARSIKNFPLKTVLDQIQEEYRNDTGEDLIVKYGGHDGAGGLTIRKDRLIDFEMYFVLKADELLSEEDYFKRVRIDLGLNEDEVTPELYDMIKSLEPYGEGFEEPVIGVRNFTPINPKDQQIFGQNENLGLKGRHIKVTSWRGGKAWKELGEPDKVHIVGKLGGIDSYTGKPVIYVDPENIRSE